MKRPKIYDRWATMKRRCANINNISYEDYGGRGITVCEEWQEFTPFYNWAMANGYSEELQLDRKDNDKGYSPDNCRFVTAKINNSNRRDNHTITINGVTKTMVEWAEKTGINQRTLYNRVNRGWTIEDLLKPVRIVRKTNVI